VWDCEKCGTQAIADSLETCPACGARKGVAARPEPAGGPPGSEEKASSPPRGSAKK
jgi:ABC-type ATPase with predicted acetyltransferase domain